MRVLLPRDKITAARQSSRLAVVSSTPPYLELALHERGKIVYVSNIPFKKGQTYIISTLGATYFRGANSALLVYDIANFVEQISLFFDITSLDFFDDKPSHGNKRQSHDWYAR